MKIGIVGAASLLGKELADELAASSLAAGEVVLLDEEETAGQLTTVGDEASFIQRLEPGSFAGLDLIFFAGSAEQAAKHWIAVKKAGAGVVDLTAALRGEAGVVVRSPWVSDGGRLDLGTTAVVPAHVVSVMLGVLAARCVGLGLNALVATVLEPASQRGQAGMDEMHQQTVNLLSFQSLPQDEFDVQVAFNLVPSLGSAAKVSMAETEQRILSEYRSLGALPELELQMVHAPVFHGYGVSLLLEGSRTMTADEVERALEGEHVDVRTEALGNVDAAGQREILVRTKPGASRRMWVWMAADNLKLTALHGIACGAELMSLRPLGSVQ